MNCEDLQLNLPLYTDDILSAGELRVLDGHLAQCPLCRQKLDDFHAMRNDLRGLARPAMTQNLMFSIRNAVAAELAPVSSRDFKLETFASDDSFNNWWKRNFMPSMVGAAASLIVGIFLLSAMISATREDQNQLLAKNSRPSPAILLPNGNFGGETDLIASEYAHTRLSVAGESPSVNPNGALVAMTKSFVRGKLKDDEVTVVADILGSGLAQISEVVEPSRDRQAVAELQNALQTNPEYAPPFVPAQMDGRSDTVRVVFKIQTVNVSMNVKKRVKL